jgi:hypothetical protein
VTGIWQCYEKHLQITLWLMLQICMTSSLFQRVNAKPRYNSLCFLSVSLHISLVSYIDISGMSCYNFDHSFCCCICVICFCFSLQKWMLLNP